MSLRVLVILLGLFSYLSATGGALVFCTGAEGTREIELAVGEARCAESCTDEPPGATDPPPAPECVDEVLDVGDVRPVAAAPMALPPLDTLCGIVPAPTLRPLHFEERKNHPPQHLAHVATVVLVI